MEKKTGDAPAPAAGDAARAAGSHPPVVRLEYAGPGAAGGAPDGPDRMDAVAGCAIVVVGLLAGCGAIGLFAFAIRQTASPEPDPVGPAFLFSGSMVLAALAMACRRAMIAGPAASGPTVRTDEA